ncbi:MAG TPA: hypothetical protein PK082_03555 [Phycisphaerae bacterium]|nr:hypothetical protein [Phycisphaerae bacterium]
MEKPAAGAQEHDLQRSGNRFADAEVVGLLAVLEVPQSFLRLTDETFFAVFPAAFADVRATFFVAMILFLNSPDTEIVNLCGRFTKTKSHVTLIKVSRKGRFLIFLTKL